MTAEHTAAWVAMHGRMELLGRRRRVPSAKPPTQIESDYASALVSIVDMWREAANAPRPILGRLDDLASRVHLERARYAVTSTIKRVPVVAERSARRVANHQSQQLARQTEAALGIRVPTVDRGLDPRIQHFVNENVALIQKLGNATMDDVALIITRAYANGEGDDEIAQQLQDRFAIAERHARFIAADQTQRLYSQVTRMRHQEIGVVAFEWETMADGRVRASHATKHGRIFPYEGSRAPSFFPGDEIGCRCQEKPVFDNIKALAFAGKGRRRVA